MRSELKANMLDTLHGAGIEIMTPTVMNQRPIPADVAVIPHEEHAPETDAETDTGKAERLMFDKAELAARVESFREQSATLTQEIKDLSAEDAEANAAEIRWREHQLAALQGIIERFDSSNG